MRRKIVAGNWKLHGSRQFATELLGQVAAGLPKRGVEVVILLHCQLTTASRWRGGRVVEGAALEMLYRGNSIEGSNPSLSVIQPAPGPAFLRPEEGLFGRSSPNEPEGLKSLALH